MVKKNKGAAGIDGMTVNEVEVYIKNDYSFKKKVIRKKVSTTTS